jgi:hypothetical protein
MLSSLRWLYITDGVPFFLFLVSNTHGTFLITPQIFRCRSTDRSLRLQWDPQGGWQDIYTVIPNSSATTQNPATCANVTFQHPPLQVSAAVSGGALSQYGWVPQVRSHQRDDQEWGFSCGGATVYGHSIPAEEWHRTLHIGVQSSFMIDLNQVSLALRNSTARSLILLDEFGKGTAAAGSSLSPNLIYLSKLGTMLLLLLLLNHPLLSLP